MGKILEFENSKKDKLRIYINDMNIITQIKLKNKELKFLDKITDLALISKERNEKLNNFLNKFYKYCTKQQIEKINNIINEYRN